MSDADRKWLPTATCILLISVCLVELLLCCAGGRVTFYALIAAATTLAALSPSRSRRLWSVIATLFVLVLLACDHQAGIRLRRAATQTLIRRATMQPLKVTERNNVERDVSGHQR